MILNHLPLRAVFCSFTFFHPLKKLAMGTEAHNELLEKIRRQEDLPPAERSNKKATFLVVGVLFLLATAVATYFYFSKPLGKEKVVDSLTAPASDDELLQQVLANRSLRNSVEHLSAVWRECNMHKNSAACGLLEELCRNHMNLTRVPAPSRENRTIAQLYRDKVISSNLSKTLQSRFKDLDAVFEKGLATVSAMRVMNKSLLIELKWLLLEYGYDINEWAEKRPAVEGEPQNVRLNDLEADGVIDQALYDALIAAMKAAGTTPDLEGVSVAGKANVPSEYWEATNKILRKYNFPPIE
jgi:hypothetical protein